MKKNDYKACIEHISPDSHFKTRLKEKVLTSGHKVKKKKKKMERCGGFSRSMRGGTCRLPYPLCRFPPGREPQ